MRSCVSPQTPRVALLRSAAASCSAVRRSRSSDSLALRSCSHRVQALPHRPDRLEHAGLLDLRPPLPHSGLGRSAELVAQGGDGRLVGGPFRGGAGARDGEGGERPGGGTGDEADHEADDEERDRIHVPTLPATPDIGRYGGPVSAPIRPEVNADDLRVLLAVARSGRLTTAAGLLRIDHTTVRRRIDRLEAALGARLLDRGADGWELTAIGREVAARAAPLEEAVERAIEAAAGGERSLHGTVRVVAPEGFAVTVATPALARLRRAEPGVLVELVASTRPLGPRGAGFDIAVTVGAPVGPRTFSEAIASYSHRLYAAPDYLAAHPPIRTPADLHDHALVFYVDALLTVRELDLAPLLEGMRVGFGSTSVVAQVEATRRGAGVGLLHSFMAEGDPALVPVLPEQVDFRLRFSLSVRRESRGLAAVAAVRDALLAEVARSRLDPPD